MSREIKFRAWQRKAKIFLTEDRLVNPIGVPVISEGNCFRLNHAHVDFQQFTGLKDKNGVEIYEGDVFDCIYSSDGCTSHKFVVEYYEPATRFQLKRIGGECQQSGVYQTISDVGRYGVVGNVYENPELLEKENLDVKDQAAAQ